MTITALLQRFVDDELSRAPAMAEKTVELTLAQLQQPRDGMLSAADREHYLDLRRTLPSRAQEFVRKFSESLQSIVQADLHGSDSGPPTAAPTVRGLELMDETRVEEDIEISGAAQLITGSAEWELRELQTFTSTLAGQTHVSAETNPLRPLAYARALWEATCVVTPMAMKRAILLRTAAGVMSGQLKMAWAAACSRLESQGIEPGIYRTVVLAPGPVVPRTPFVDVTRPGALGSLLSSMPSTGQAAASTSGVHGGSSPAFEQALTRLETLLQHAGSGSGTTAPGTPQLGEHRASLLANIPEVVDRQIVELLSRLFEAVLSDMRLPPAYRTIIARLQVSALRVALVDPTMLEVYDHPVWRLMNRIGSVAETYTQTTDPRWSALLAHCESMVEGMARTPVQDASLYRQSLARLELFLGEQLREQQQRARPAIDALLRTEQRDEFEHQISQRLTEQTAPMRISPTIRRFVTSTWAQVLAEAMQRYGNEDDATAGYLKATDDLLWSLKLPDHPQSRKRLLAMLPSLLQKLRDGMALVNVSDADQRPLLDELMAIHTEALRPGKPAAAPEPEPTPQEIVQRMRDESEWDTPSRPPFRDSLIDLSSMETVPAELLPSAISEPQDDAAKQIDALQPGVRQMLFLHGRWTRVQLLWRSPRGRFFLFAGPDPAHTHSVTRRALERLNEEKLMKVLDDVSLVQRAVDSLTKKLTLPS